MTGLPLWTGRPAGLSWALTGGGAALTGVIFTIGGRDGSSSSDKSTTSITFFFIDVGVGVGVGVG